MNTDNIIIENYSIENDTIVAYWYDSTEDLDCEKIEINVLDYLKDNADSYCFEDRCPEKSIVYVKSENHDFSTGDYKSSSMTENLSVSEFIGYNKETLIQYIKK